MITEILIPLSAVTAAYLLGALNFAIIITRLLRGEDIRTLGNRNPGASNMGRVVGRGWGILVLALDVLKVILPIAAARMTLFRGGTPMDYGILYLMGIAAVLGHIFPVWYGFKGGGGVSAMLAVSLWFIPIEYLAAMLFSGFLALAFLRGKGYWLTQWTPILFITITPFAALLINLTVFLPIWKGITLGGHPWTVIAGSFTLSLMMLGLNMRLLTAKISGRHWEKHPSV